MTARDIAAAQALQEAGQFIEAADAYSKTLGEAAEIPQVLSMIAGDARARGDHTAARALYARVVAKLPNDPNALANLAVACRDIGDMEAAFAHVRQSLRLQPEEPSTHVLHAELMLANGEWTEGLAAYEWRNRLPDIVQPARDIALPVWNGDALDGRLLVVAEQGLGDTLQFCRFASEANDRAHGVTLAVPPLLAPLLKCLADIEIVSAVENDPRRYAAKTNLMSLPHVLRLVPESIESRINYLRPPEQSRRRAAAFLDKTALKVGLNWRGNDAGAVDRGRSLKLGDLSPLAEIDGVAFVSLQHQTDDEERGAWPGNSLINANADFASFQDTAAIVEALDLVITTDTALAHIAGAVGTKTWLLVKHVPSWRWGLTGTRTPWYPSITLYRQPSPGDWDSVIRNITDNLRALA